MFKLDLALCLDFTGSYQWNFVVALGLLSNFLYFVILFKLLGQINDDDDDDDRR